MPELPEVETIRRELEPLISGKTFAKPIIHMPSTIAYPAPEEFAASLEGCKVTNTGRRGKYLFINLDRGILVVHLRMTGNLVYAGQGLMQEERFLRILLPFIDGSALIYSDMRRFGRLWLVGNQEELQSIVLKNIGPDILTEVDLEKFIELLGKRERSRLKALLLDQGFAAGMGNIYTDECLFRCGVNPNRQVSSLSRGEMAELFEAVRAVLAEGIEHGGTTFRDYRSASGALGDFQSHLAVYGRKDEPCRCGAVIEKTRVAGRGTYYCPRCQK
ncbi:MAG: DNA-formamidopyrimidine glycosylase [Bacillota bacterium]